MYGNFSFAQKFDDELLIRYLFPAVARSGKSGEQK
jgi:hypothetical protein